MSKRDDHLHAVRSIIDEADLSSIRRKLSRTDVGEGWSESKIKKTEEVYRNWLYLRYKYWPKEIAPLNRAADIFWHFHILDTRKYHWDCERIFGSYLHHFPYLGLRGPEDYLKLQEAIDESKSIYFQEYGKVVTEFHTLRIDKANKEQPSDHISQPTKDRALPCYIRIRKNASSSMMRLISGQYSTDRIFSISAWARAGTDGNPITVDSSDQELAAQLASLKHRQWELDCIVSNVPFGVHQKLARKVRYFTLVREPVSRCLSWWKAAYKARFDRPAWSLVEAYDQNIRRIVDDLAIPELSNDQTRLIAGVGTRAVQEDDFLKAKDNIEEYFDYAGCVEDFDSEIERLIHLMGWNNCRAFRENETGDVELRLPPDSAEIFEDANEWDIRLYEWLQRRSSSVDRITTNAI